MNQTVELNLERPNFRPNRSTTKRRASNYQSKLTGEDIVILV